MISLLRDILLVLRLTFAKHPRLRMIAQMGFVTVILILSTIALSAWMSLPAYKDFFGYQISEDWAIGLSIGFAVVISGMMTYPVRAIVAWVRARKHPSPFLDDILTNISAVIMTISVLTLAVLLWFDITKNTMGRDIRSYDLGSDFVAANVSDGVTSNAQMDQLLEQQTKIEMQLAAIDKRYTYGDGRVVFRPKPHTSNTVDQWNRDVAMKETLESQLNILRDQMIQINQFVNTGNSTAQATGQIISDKAKGLMSMGVWLVYIIMFLSSLGLQAIVVEVYTTDQASQKLYNAGKFDDSITSFFKGIFSGGFWTRHSGKGGKAPSVSQGPGRTKKKGGSQHQHRASVSGGGVSGVPSMAAAAPRQATGQKKYQDNSQVKSQLSSIIDDLYAANGKSPVKKKAVKAALSGHGITIPDANFYRWVDSNPKVL